MATEVIMPKVDMDQETGTVGRWLKQDGDEVKQGETILEIETDKVAIDVEAPASGILDGIRVEEGQTVPIATIIAYILKPGESLPQGTEPADHEEEKAAGVSGMVEQTDWEAPATPVARNMAQASGIDLSQVSGSGPGGKITKKDVQAALQSPQLFDNGRDKVYATPAARRIAKENDMELAGITGSGPDGRVQGDDVRAALEAREAAAEKARPVERERPEIEVVPLRGKRQVIAGRMTDAYQTVPHINFTARVDMTRFMETRAQLNAHAQKRGTGRISATALLVKCIANTLAQHPWLNSSFQEEEIHLYKDVHMGVAVALEDGLIVPVVHHADKKPLARIAAEVADLAERARENELLPEEVRGGTFTLSNLGPFGIENFTAIINPPQAAILATGAIQQEVVPDENGQVVVRPVMHMTLAADHRVVDGAVAAQFVADLKEVLQTPVLLL